jgi:hypothetical protein
MKYQKALGDPATKSGGTALSHLIDHRLSEELL